MSFDTSLSGCVKWLMSIASIVYRYESDEIYIIASMKW